MSITTRALTAAIDMMKLVLLLLLLTGCSQVRLPPIHMIGILGDSLTEGYGTSNPPATSFASDLAQQSGWHVTTQAIGGATTMQVLPQLPLLLRTNPDVVVLEVGTNDVRWATSLSLFHTQYQTLYQQVQGRRILCLSPWPSPGYHIAPYAQIIQQICGDSYLDISDLAVPANETLPNWHPNDHGAALIAARIMRYLQVSVACQSG